MCCISFFFEECVVYPTRSTKLYILWKALNSHGVVWEVIHILILLQVSISTNQCLLCPS
jgi:hypothetical protein